MTSAMPQGERDFSSESEVWCTLAKYGGLGAAFGVMAASKPSTQNQVSLDSTSGARVAERNW
jgi:hypothetical protein